MEPVHQIRPAIARDCEVVADMLSAMVEDMAASGGYCVTSLETRRAYFVEMVSEQLPRSEFLHVLAQGADEPCQGIAAGEIVTLPPVFDARPVLHISAVYVAPRWRGRGIGPRLIDALLDWGRAMGCTEADLNVLDRSPAVRVYERMGFREIQRKMVREL